MLYSKNSGRRLLKNAPFLQTQTTQSINIKNKVQHLFFFFYILRHLFFLYSKFEKKNKTVLTLHSHHRNICYLKTEHEQIKRMRIWRFFFLEANSNTEHKHGNINTSICTRAVFESLTSQRDDTDCEMHPTNSFTF